MTKTEIFNLGLSRLGNQRVTSDTEASPTAQIIRTHWDSVRRALLKTDDWNFASRAVELSAISSAEATVSCDVYGYTYAYALPFDLISVVKFNGVETATRRTLWKVASGVLYSSDTEAKLEYIKDETDCTLWPDEFSTAISWFLAAAISPSITNSAETGMRMLEIANNLIKSAASADTDQEGRLNILYGIEHSAYRIARQLSGGASDAAYLEASAWRDFNPSS